MPADSGNSGRHLGLTSSLAFWKMFRKTLKHSLTAPSDARYFRYSYLKNRLISKNIFLTDVMFFFIYFSSIYQTLLVSPSIFVSRKCPLGYQ